MKRMLLVWVVATTAFLHPQGAGADEPIRALPCPVDPRIPDALALVDPGDVRLEGWLGRRVESNRVQRLMEVDLDTLLAGYRRRPGKHPWIGEHIGKWLHAATLAWANSGDPALKARLDHAVNELLRTQEPDGYLGTYDPGHRFGLYPGADWDVWSHKYNLIGLLTYHEYTGSEPALLACRRMGDLLVRTFPAEKSILKAGTHMGMAATSVLEPMVRLYRRTGDQRYLDFARYLVRAWEEPGGPRILSALLSHGRVDRTANGKAYELLSNLVGLCELYRVTGDPDHLRAVLAAWEDIVERRLYVTGSASQGEHFRGDHELPNHEGAHVAETCVTVTWLQLNLQLLRLTGDARFARELERTLYNHLTAAQHPAGRTWCYFTPLEGHKAYGAVQHGVAGINCCASSGPRGLALAPMVTYGMLHGAAREPVLTILTFESSRARLLLNGRELTVEQRSEFPFHGRSVLAFGLSEPVRFGLRIRAPDWADPVWVLVGGKPLEVRMAQGWVDVPARLWRSGDEVELRFRLGTQLVPGTHGNRGRSALCWGPFVMACDGGLNPGLPPLAALGWTVPMDGTCSYDGEGHLRFRTRALQARDGQRVEAVLVPFADAGAGGGEYRVWLWGPEPGWQRRLSLLLGGRESRSRPGNQPGSIVDGNPDSIVVTYDGAKADEDWYAVELPRPARISRVVFRHGRTFHDGGWFDVTEGKPRVQIRRSSDGPWETVARLDSYPAASATDAAGLRPGEGFEVRLSNAIEAVAVRVIGRPACGDNPAQSFSSCAELEAYED